MASQVCDETLAFMKGDDGVREMEINGDLLMSLMEESPSDESDDDRLDSLIRSFEAEISGMKGHDESHDDNNSSSSIGSELLVISNIEDDAQSWNIEEQDYWASSSELIGVEWVDMDLMPFDDRSWCIDPCGGQKDGIIIDGFAMGEHEYYYSFWQDNNNLMACN